MSDIASTQSEARVPTDYYLESDDYTSLLETSQTPQSRFLLSWLADPKADCSQLLEWLSGRDFNVQRLENPALAILKSLPQLHEPLESVAREILVRRLSHAILWLSASQEDLAKVSVETWLEFFDLIRRLGDSLLADSIGSLRRSLERYDATFKLDREARRDFTDLVIFYQTTNELESRWYNLIRGNNDPVLYASLIDSMRGFFAMPSDVGYLAFNSAFHDFCKRLDRAKKDDVYKLSLVKQLESIPSRHPTYKYFLELAKAKLCTSFRWLPQAHRNVNLIATTTDLTVLESWAWSRINDYLESLARIRYRIVLEQSDLAAPLKAHMLAGIVNAEISETARPTYCHNTSNATRVKAMDYYSELALAET